MRHAPRGLLQAHVSSRRHAIQALGLIHTLRISLLCGLVALPLPSTPAPTAPTDMTQRVFPPYAGHATGREEIVTVALATPIAEGRRVFTLSSTQAQRDGAAQRRVIEEHSDAPSVHSPSPLFDALFALAVDDARLNSVDTIRDDAYNQGRAMACHCFQTGELWHYVWTRDLAYATDLGLAWLDPVRAAASLSFKTSPWREGVNGVPGIPAESLQIVQDTGSGGSWPVSTDRVSWAVGAEQVSANLYGEAHQRFRARAKAALLGTVEADRLAAYDPATGLYGGEQSFLDWRVQSYAPWIHDDLSRMAGAKALSTNVLHFRALSLLAQWMAADGDETSARRYSDWADALRQAIDRTFWLKDVQQYASLTNDSSPPVALHKFDMLGTALAIISGVAPPERAAAALARYPRAPFGSPVIWPQQPNVPVYHNRAIWPFVTAYELRAARQVGNVAVASQAFESLFRGAALNLSNMENLEWLTGLPQFDDGPVINSRRQIWSVAAYLGAVAESVFGWQPQGEVLRIQPFLTTAARREMGEGKEAVLSGMQWRGHRVELVLHLPPMPAEQGGPRVYPVQGILLNGAPVAQAIAASELNKPVNRVEVLFASPVTGDERIAKVPMVDALDKADPRVTAPDVPRLLALSERDGAIDLRYAAPPYREALRFNVYRDGTLLARELASSEWTDPSPVPGKAHVYEMEAVGAVSRLHSHLSQPAQWTPGARSQKVQLGERFTVDAAGHYGFELLYRNHAYETQTGVTNAVKFLQIEDSAGQAVARGVIQMPHIEPQADLRASTLFRATLAKGSYRVVLSDFFNMSFLASNTAYSGPGGLSGRLNHAEISHVQVLALPDPNP